MQQEYHKNHRMKNGTLMGGYRKGDKVLILVECLQGDRTSPRRGREGWVVGKDEMKIWVRHSGGITSLDNRQIMLLEKNKKDEGSYEELKEKDGGEEVMEWYRRNTTELVPSRNKENRRQGIQGFFLKSYPHH